MNPRAIPIIGALWECKRRHHVKAIREHSFTILLSLMPLWLALFLIPTLDQNQTLQTQLSNQVMSGNLFLYSAALCGPLPFLSLATFAKEDGSYSVFPHRYTFFFIFIGVVVLAAFIYAYIYSMPPSSTNFDTGSYWTLALGTFITSLIIIYLVNVYKVALNDFSSGTPSYDDPEFWSDWEESKDE